VTSSSFAPLPLVLTGRHAELQPLGQKHLDDLLDAVSDAELWRWMPRQYFLDRGLAREWIDTAVTEQADGRAVPFAIIDRTSGRAVGSTRLFDFHREHRGLEIGWTWIGTAHQRTALNTECKRLLFGHAFDDLDALRVQLKTDSRNKRSRAAMERVGASFEGVLRNHVLLPSGDMRHSAYYSVIAEDWPAIRQRLDELLDRRR
jgi:RimJ/RimL family protein N-acetyltransferase